MFPVSIFKTSLLNNLLTLNRLPIGALGVLHVLDSHRRLGLGSLMVRCLAKEISELGDEVLAPVIKENTVSRKMFEKLGFQKIDDLYWTH